MCVMCVLSGLIWILFIVNVDIGFFFEFLWFVVCIWLIVNGLDFVCVVSMVCDYVCCVG